MRLCGNKQADTVLTVVFAESKIEAAHFATKKSDVAVFEINLSGLWIDLKLTQEGGDILLTGLADEFRRMLLSCESSQYRGL
jgi:hypothetical protein